METSTDSAEIGRLMNEEERSGMSEDQTGGTTSGRASVGVHGVNLEVFVNKELDAIQKKASGKAQEYAIIRESCNHVKGIVRSYAQDKDTGLAGSKYSMMQNGHGSLLPEEVTMPLLSLLRSCLETKNSGVVEPALGCIHKLIAYAYIQGETRPSGRLDDAKNMVNTVVLMSAKSANNAPNASVQLAAVKTLLTSTTAEHFVPHGDCLMLAVRTAFNISINGSTADVRNAASSALLQMLNTIFKRVAHQLVTPRTTPSKPFESEKESMRDEFSVSKEESYDFGSAETISHSEVMKDLSQSLLKPIKTNSYLPEPVQANMVSAADQRAAQLSQLAERSDLRGLEEAIAETGTPSLKTLQEDRSEGAKLEHMTSVEEGKLLDHPEKAHDELSPKLKRADTPPDPRRALMRDVRAAEWGALTVAEKDIVIVFTAMCKMASRETGPGAAGTYFHSGKLLALDTVVRVLTNPMHDWEHIRPELAAHLRQPLCLTILRNCKSPYESAVTASVKLLCAILHSPSLRLNLRAEIGALYPLVLLRPLENTANSSLAPVFQASAGLRGLEAICSSPQMLVDIFVNFDCSLQSSNLFERTVHTLGRETSNLGRKHQPTLDERAKVAQQALIRCIESLDTWAGPLKPWLGNESEHSYTTTDQEALESSKDAIEGIGHDVLRQLHLDKAKKSSLKEGLVYFNSNPIKGIQYLVDSDVIDSSPNSVATFLREHTSELDPEAIGELLGHHADSSIEIMYAYVRQFSFNDLTVDSALRLLLKGFRLPGEAQKIDRIMEKFAEKYCEDNPGAFPVADAAYLLAFAIIMLNTDAHNPMAERRIGPEDFVTMCTYQTESGDYDQILSTEDLLELHERILNQEIAVPEAKGQLASEQRFAWKKSTSLRRLAAATGLSKLVGPFHAGNSWDKQHGAEQENLEFVKATAQISSNSLAQGQNLWRSATHAEHARPMLQIAGDSITKSLRVGMAAATSIAEAMPILVAYEQVIKLSALLWLEGLTENLVEGLATAAGFGLWDRNFSIPTCPSPGSPEEARNVAALSRLMSIGSSKEAGLLGSGWVVIFRILSGLESLKQDLSPTMEEPFSPSSFKMKWIKSLKTKRTHSASPSLSRNKSKRKDTPIRTVMRESQGPLSVREDPGMGLVIWAETSGATVIDKIFMNSVNLDGESILTFMRALCAISQEELDPVDSSPTKIFLLQRIVECAYFNASRIRLVWQRIWTVVSQHLVSAACSLDPYVAMFAVDSLRQLADKLLCRSELAGFAAQGDAIRPLGSVLRCSDSVAVRELAIACVAHIVDSHTERIGGGWWAVIDALGIAASDSSAQVVANSIDIMCPVFQALYKGQPGDGLGGHECLEECIAAAIAAIGNTSCGEDLAPATAALELFQTLCQNLAESESHNKSPSNWLAIFGPLAAIARSDARPEIADTAATVLFYSITTNGERFDEKIWNEIVLMVIGPLLSLHPSEVPAAFVMEIGLPSSKLSTSPLINRRTLRRRLRKKSEEAELPSPDSAQLSAEGPMRLVRQASNYLPPLWEMMLSQPDSCKILLEPCFHMLWCFSVSRNSTVSDSAGILARKMLGTLNQCLQLEGWILICKEMKKWLTWPSIEAAMRNSPRGNRKTDLRTICSSIMMGFKLIHFMLTELSMPNECVLQLLTAMKSSLDTLKSLNDNIHFRKMLQHVLQETNQTSLPVPDTIDESPVESTHEASIDLEAIAKAVISSVEISNPEILPALARNELDGEKIYLQTMVDFLHKGIVDEATRKEISSSAISLITTHITNSCDWLEKNNASAESRDDLWLESMRAAFSGDCFIALQKIPLHDWSEHKKELKSCASKLVKSHNSNVRKGVSAFFGIFK